MEFGMQGFNLGSEITKCLFDHRRVFDDGNDPDGAFALTAGFDIDPEHKSMEWTRILA